MPWIYPGSLDPAEDDEPSDATWPDALEEPNEIVAELLGPDGERLSVLLDRPTVPLGYHPEPKVVTRIFRL